MHNDVTFINNKCGKESSGEAPPVSSAHKQGKHIALETISSLSLFQLTPFTQATQSRHELWHPYFLTPDLFGIWRLDWRDSDAPPRLNFIAPYVYNLSKCLEKMVRKTRKPYYQNTTNGIMTNMTVSARKHGGKSCTRFQKSTICCYLSNMQPPSSTIHFWMIKVPPTRFSYLRSFLPESTVAHLRHVASVQNPWCWNLK